MPIRTYFVDHINHCRYPLNGVIPSDNQNSIATSAKLFRNHMVLGASELPPKVDFRPVLTAVENQLQANSCVANAFAGAYEYLINKTTGNPIDVSRLFLYYNARYRGSPWGITDSGCMLDQAIGALSDYGICLESIWPYDLRYVNATPNMAAYQAAKSHKIVDWLRLSVNLNEMKSCLAQGYPFAFGVELFESFGQATRTGLVPMPSPAERDPSRAWDPSRQMQQHRFHAMLAVGYSDRTQVFLIRNSWGAQWGDQGYCYMPYAYLSDPSLCFDAWAIRKLATDDFSRDNWSYEDNTNYGEGTGPHRLGALRALEHWDIIDVNEPDKPEEVSDATTASTDKTDKTEN